MDAELELGDPRGVPRGPADGTPWVRTTQDLVMNLTDMDCFDSLSFSIPGRNLALHVHRTTLEGVSKRVFTHVKVTPINK